MGLFFGTDGLRGIVNKDLSFDIAYKCGNALSSIKENPTILVGRDTRITGEYLTLALAGGATSGGAKVIDLGIIPTAGVAYLTKKLSADYGVVISASHNSQEYNGIKIFDSNGYKLGDKEEERVERNFIKDKVNGYLEVGSYLQKPYLIKKYEEFLTSAFSCSLTGLKIVIDGANGASYKIAPKVFKKLGAKVISSSCNNNGKKINENCGALYPQTLARQVKKHKADVGFAYDGDADRLIVVDERGKVVDGDVTIYLLAKYLKEKGKLKGNTVVGTSHTNMAIENALKKEDINFIRTDIGDKYVLKELVEKDYSLGGEQSGHIILKDVHTTGDGILSAIAVSNMLIEKGEKLSQMIKVDLYPQENVNVIVEDKMKIINSEILSEKISVVRKRLGKEGRVMVRASGTEPKIRIMVESPDKDKNLLLSQELQALVEKINKN